MKNESENSRRIAKNTLLLYFRMLITMGVSLYTSRVVLNTLGVEDYGIYSVVGGVVAMFTIINASLTSASQRFITFELGKPEGRKLPEVFSAIVSIHIFIVILIFILAETLGLWFLNTRVNIFVSRMPAANWVFQCSLVTLLINIMNVPYNASIIAHEKMNAFAYIGIIEVVLKLGVVYILNLINVDKLKLFAVLYMVVSVLIRFIYANYCRNKFNECRFRLSWNKDIFGKIASFAGWNFIGTSSYVLMTQGVNILLNVFYGVVVNAAQGIANQVQNAITGFITNFMTALNPQITKAYARNNKDYMMKLIFQGARYSFYLMFFLSLPILIETETVLRVWLKIVPDYTIIFIRLSLIYSISQTLSNALITVVQATGDIKKYQILVGGLQMLNFPLSYIALKLNSPPQVVMVIAIIISFFCLAARLYLLHGMINFPVVKYVKNVLMNVSLVSMLSVIIPVVSYLNMSKGLLRFVYICGVSLVSTSVVIYLIGLSSSERLLVHRKIISLRVKYGPD